MTTPVVSSAVDVWDFPGHANLLGLVSAYYEESGKPIPWALLLDAAERLQAGSNSTGVQVASSEAMPAAAILADIIQDLSDPHVGWLASDLQGYRPGPRFNEVAPPKQDDLKKHQEAARTALEALGLLPGPHPRSVSSP